MFDIVELRDEFGQKVTFSRLGDNFCIGVEAGRDSDGIWMTNFYFKPQQVVGALEKLGWTVEVGE